MKHFFFIVFFLFLFVNLHAQTTNNFEISFKNAVHHEAEIQAEFNDLKGDNLSVRMSRTSPGRYAIHEFAKNVYGLSAFDGQGNKLNINRSDPSQWDIEGHDGTVKIIYTLFANHGDGTYSQIDETHAHLNIPATFIYAPAYADRPVQIKFHPRVDLGWKVATQLKQLQGNTYYANNLDYFMDSPVEISNHKVKSFQEKSNGTTYTINFVLHQMDEYGGFEQYFENVKKIVEQEMAVYAELPDFDYGSYTFLACYMPNVDGDGMEHRNSTVLTDLNSLTKGGSEENIGTVAHEFFHAWNVERIRPKSLEPFDYTEANMSGELWFAEGFTRYYTSLTLCRAGIISREKYAEGIARDLNYVWNSPARDYFSPIEMSYQAPFVDAATSVDAVNRENTFISYYTYGSVLGLALDLSLRNLGNDKNLDDFMKLVWKSYGKNETPYTLTNLEQILASYISPSFSKNFFNSYIYDSQMPDYKSLLSSVGIEFGVKYPDLPSFGAWIKNKNNKWLINSNPIKSSSLYNAGLVKGDEIVSIDGVLTNDRLNPDAFLKSRQPGTEAKVIFNRFGAQKQSTLTFEKNNSYKTFIKEDASKAVIKRQNSWLNAK